MKVTLNVGEININRMVDLPNKKIVRVFTREEGMVELWTGDQYDAIGEWTNADVDTKLKELFN